MKRGLVIGIIAIVVVVAIFGISYQLTGKATLTPKANYGPIDTNSKNYHSCVYLEKDDGWSVTQTKRVKYFDGLTGETKEITDSCATDTKVTEYDCDSMGYMVERPVICPSNMVCKEGSCVLK